MDDYTIEPDPGQTATIEVNDPGNFYRSAHQWYEPVFIGDSQVLILEYEQLENLGYVAGHRARMKVQGIK